MMTNLLNLIKKNYPLTALDPAEFSTMKVNGMKFCVKAYHAEGLGHLSLMQAKGFFGLMQMDTLMLVAEEKDAPLLSYDRIHAMGNDTLIIELYDTLLGEWDASRLDALKAKYADLPERDPGVHWYDAIRLPQSLSLKAKKAESTRMDALALEYLKSYCEIPAEPVTDRTKKVARNQAYVNGLLEHGGPSTDVFCKKLGTEKTRELFEQVLFGTGRK